ncbi:hypothetical protein DMN77_20445 [Paenibacillus sp. 79R4]|nr:hypothetical protein [Paenibacillus sp. 79R4]
MGTFITKCPFIRPVSIDKSLNVEKTVFHLLYNFVLCLHLVIIVFINNAVKDLRKSTGSISLI